MTYIKAMFRFALIRSTLAANLRLSKQMSSRILWTLTSVQFRSPQFFEAILENYIGVMTTTLDCDRWVYANVMALW